MYTLFGVFFDDIQILKIQKIKKTEKTIIFSIKSRSLRYFLSSSGFFIINILLADMSSVQFQDSF